MCNILPVKKTYVHISLLLFVFHYSSTMTWLQSWLLFKMIKSAVICIRGSRSHTLAWSDDIELAMVEDQFKSWLITGLTHLHYYHGSITEIVSYVTLLLIIVCIYIIILHYFSINYGNCNYSFETARVLWQEEDIHKLLWY